MSIEIQIRNSKNFPTHTTHIHTYTQIDELGLINVSTEIDDVYLTIALHVSYDSMLLY